MILEKYKDSNLLFNSNFMEKTSENGLFGYRGELIIVPGEIDEKDGHPKPPIDLMLGAVLLADDKLKMVVGSIDEIASLPVFIEKYKDDFAPDMKALIYVVNLKSPAQIDVDGITFVLIPMVQGITWNEAIEEMRLEKSDFKGQSPADKILTLYKEMADYKPKFAQSSLDDVLTNTTNAVRENWGAV